ncbi:putative bifunctional diguanylate cyclase/phosphodiesterase [Legionella waltersii]|uniref:Inner membrane protein n=1 Tax=Legionella waltersii TaxID=66969 RepID=A0A0W1A0Z2_9GAMM|nr:EAL domain-containing protein [Legionella waltersii]KTD74986.1 inner membrane protein [Legionella waltersii]SNV08288.1 inner membrane protein [Legionella waltersii]
MSKNYKYNNLEGIERFGSDISTQLDSQLQTHLPSSIEHIPLEHHKKRDKDEELLAMLFSNIPLSLLGELIASLIFVKIVHITENIFIEKWLYFEISGLFVQLLVVLMYYNRDNFSKLPYLYYYKISLALTYINIACLTLYTFNNNTLIISLGIVYIALTSGGSLFHCYTKNTHIFYIASIFIPYIFLCLAQGGEFIFIGIGALIYMVVSMYASNLLYFYLVQSLELSFIKHKRLNKIMRFRELLNRKQRSLTLQKNKQIKLEKELLTLNETMLAGHQLLSQKKQETLNILDIAYNSINEVVIKTKETGEIIKVNDSFFKCFQLSHHENVQDFVRYFHSIVPQHHPLHRFFPFTPHCFDADFLLQTLDNKTYEVHLKITHNKENIWIINEITEKIEQATSKDHLMHYDELTSLPNRHHFYKTLQTYIEESKQSNTLLAVIFIDIDYFKMINDSLGHQYGNQLLVYFGNLLRNTLDNKDYIARLSGDEFICLIKNLTYKSDIDSTIEKIQKALKKKVNLGPNTISIQASFGVSYYPCDSQSENELISRADSAMYHAKKKKTEYYVRYHPDLTKENKQTHQMGTELKNAFHSKLLHLVYQPVFSANAKTIEKLEVLIRWRDEAPPSSFIPIAEQLGFFHEISLWLMEEACKARITLDKILTSPLKFTINLSTSQVQNPKHMFQLIEIMNHTGCRPEWIEFEIKEQALSYMEYTKMLISIAQKHGIALSIDNFGTGISSLSLLKNIPFDTLKLDKQFIQHAHHEKKGQSILASLIHLAHQMNSRVCICGIETKDQLRQAQKEHCLLQGFYLSKPLDFISLSKIIGKS